MRSVGTGPVPARSRLSNERWQAASPHLDRALELANDERAAWLAALRAQDPALAADVEALLDEHVALSKESFLEVSPKIPPRPAPPQTGASALVAGQSLGRYRIEKLVGRGGMGEVYRAHDPRLNRPVAIKVVRTGADDPSRSKLIAEARAASALNHPNVCTVHEVDEAGAQAFIVMELVEGRPLPEVIGRDGLPGDRVVRLATQVAAALAHAHQRGIVHRDLKSANIMVAPGGAAKVLDFGIARRLPSTAAAAPPGPESGAGLTGTAAYMAPECLRGSPADERSDIWSLGVVLHEMLAGQRPFGGGSLFELTAAILRGPLPAMAASVPPTLQAIVRRCLQREPGERYQRAGEVVAALETAVHATAAASATRPPTRRAVVALAVAAAAALGFSAATFVDSTRDARPSPRVSRLTDMRGLEEFPALSPDGRSVAFAASVGGSRQLFLRLIAGGSPLRITHDAADHLSPRWLPDGSRLVYFSPPRSGTGQGDIWEVPALGGNPRRLTASLSDADVAADGRLALFRLEKDAVQLVVCSRDGTVLSVLARFAPGGYYRYPRWSPDGRRIAFQQGDGVRFDVFVVGSDGNKGPVRLTDDGSRIDGLSWTADGRALVYSSSLDSTLPYLPQFALWRVALDGRAERITGDESSYRQPDIHHASGVLVASRLQLQSELWKFPVDGPPARNVQRAAQLTRQTGQVRTPSVAPSDREVVFLSDSGGHANLWVLSIDSGELRQITHERGPRAAVGVPIWSPDGRSIAFVSSRGSRGYVYGLWLVKPDGSGLRNLATQGWGPAWSSDSRTLYYAEDTALKKISANGGPATLVRSERVRNAIAMAGGTLYYVVERPLTDGQPEYEVRAATPEDGPSRIIARIPASRVGTWQVLNPTLSPDRQWLALPLTDGLTTNVWALATGTGAWRQITDFGDRATHIARRVSWSSDGRFIVAAVSDGDADVVLFEGLVPAGPR